MGRNGGFRHHGLSDDSISVPAPTPGERYESAYVDDSRWYVSIYASG